MKYTYETATERISVELPDDWGGVLIRLDKNEKANDHKHSRNDRKTVTKILSLEATSFEGVLFSDESADPLGQVVLKDDTRKLIMAMGSLSERQRNVLLWVYHDGASLVECAARIGVSERRVAQIRDAALKKLKKVFI